MHAMKTLKEKVNDLHLRGEAFAIATVVRTLSVTAAKAGAKALFDQKGAVVEGWIGGGCALAAASNAAIATIRDGKPQLVSLKPEEFLIDEGITPGHIENGVTYAKNGCPSQGSMDIFIEPFTPQPELVVIGSSPVGVALSRIAHLAGFALTICAKSEEHCKFDTNLAKAQGFRPPERAAGRRFVVVSTQGNGDREALLAALNADAEFISFVGSRRKMDALRTGLLQNGPDDQSIGRIKAPAGHDIKAVTPEEIAFSILTELIEQRRKDRTALEQNRQNEMTGATHGT